MLCFPDLDYKQDPLDLHEDQFVHVARRSVSFVDEQHTMLWVCDCDDAGTRRNLILTHGLHSISRLTFEDSTTRCIHERSLTIGDRRYTCVVLCGQGGGPTQRCIGAVGLQPHSALDSSGPQPHRRKQQDAAVIQCWPTHTEVRCGGTRGGEMAFSWVVMFEVL